MFRFENDIHFQPLIPASWERIEAQIRGVTDSVSRIICYQIPGLMTSQEKFPRLGEPETQDLFLAYRNFLESQKR